MSNNLSVPDFLKNSKLGKKVDEQGTMDYTEHVKRVLDHLGIDVLCPIGGDDTLKLCRPAASGEFPGGGHTKNHG